MQRDPVNIDYSRRQSGRQYNHCHGVLSLDWYFDGAGLPNLDETIHQIPGSFYLTSEQSFERRQEYFQEFLGRLNVGDELKVGGLTLSVQKNGRSFSFVVSDDLKGNLIFPFKDWDVLEQNAGKMLKRISSFLRS